MARKIFESTTGVFAVDGDDDVAKAVVNFIRRVPTDEDIEWD